MTASARAELAAYQGQERPRRKQLSCLEGHRCPGTDGREATRIAVQTTGRKRRKALKLAEDISGYLASFQAKRESEDARRQGTPAHQDAAESEKEEPIVDVSPVSFWITIAGTVVMLI